MTLNNVAKWLLVIGGLNWGLVGISKFTDNMNLNVVSLVFGKYETLEAIVYLLVGAAAVFSLFKMINKN